MPSPARIQDLRAEVSHLRERRDLYQAKMYGPRPTSMTRMRELERELASAQERLRFAEQHPGDAG